MLTKKPFLSQGGDTFCSMLKRPGIAEKSILPTGHSRFSAEKSCLLQ